MSRKRDWFFDLISKKEQKGKELREEEETTKGKSEQGSVRRLLISFAIATVLFCICLICLKNVTGSEETMVLYVAAKDLPENMQISDVAAFETVEVPLRLVPESAIQNVQSLPGTFTACSISRNQILTDSLFREEADWEAVFKNPIEVSVGTGSIADMVGGIVRAGDLVNVSVVKRDENGEYVTISIVEKAYVSKTFTQSGEAVESHDAEKSVTIINLIIDEAQERAFHAAVEQGTLRIGRVLREHD